MLGWEILVALFAALAAGTISGLTGFGLALISVPILLFVYVPRTVVFLSVVMSIAICAEVVRDSFPDADRKIVAALVLPSFIGVVMGAEILRVVDPIYIRLFVGIFVVFSAGLLLREIRLPGAKTRWGTVVAGWASGALSTSTGLAAPPIVLLLASRDYAKHAFRATSSFYFLFMSVFGLVVLAVRSLIEAPDIPLALILVPAALLGKALGTSILKRISETLFRKLTLLFVFLTGALGVATAAWAL
ncbi:MAG: sulfite exporter TauE/SafE family protein [Rubrobacter sp.]|nr:sulfite exporter TauE/SafE family protein [Rubrobacter sp.]